MIENFFYTFAGFHGRESKCHLRIISEPEKPVIIVCSQTPDNIGTSVQNAYEIIRDAVINELSNRNNRKVFAASIIDEFADTLEKTKKIRVAVALFLLRQSSKALKNEKTFIDIFKKQDSDVVWIEHWPVGTGLLERESDYYNVQENEKGDPSWHRIDTNKEAAELGYDVSAIEKEESIFA